MTESEIPKSRDSDETNAKRIIRQVEHYFGDYNLPRDKFLLEKIGEDEGWVTMEIMLKFQRLSKLSEDPAVILKALKDGSELMQVDEEAKKIRRQPDQKLPEYNDERKKELQDMTVYVKGLDKETKDMDILIEFFSEYEGVLNVQMRNWMCKKDNTKGFKGSAFVTFKTKEAAEKFLALEEVKYDDERVLLRKWQADYFKDKAEEIAEKRKTRGNKKKADTGAKKDDTGAKKDDKEEDKKEEGLPKGSVLVLDELNETTTREDLKETLNKEFEIEPEAIAFIYYQKGEKTAKLRFKIENAAKELSEKMTASEKDFKVNDSDVKFKLLEGDEETAFLKQCVDDMASRKNKNRGHKRRGGGFKDGKPKRHRS